jgi:DNA-binding CsgD family transcriptional regulator
MEERHYKETMDVLDDFLSKINTKGTDNELIVFNLLSKNKLFTGLCFYVFDFSVKRIIYVSDSFADLLKYKKEALSYGFIYEQIHPDDFPIVVNYTANALKTGAKHPEINWRDTYFCIDFRIQKADSCYIRVLRRTCILTQDQNNNPILGITFFTDISRTKKLNNVEFYFAGQDEVILNNELMMLYSQPKSLFTESEKRIFKLLQLGKTTKQISIELHISFHTVEKHRRNMLNKTNTLNTPQLVSFVMKEGLLL